MKKRISAAKMKVLRNILGKTRMDRVKNERLKKRGSGVGDGYDEIRDIMVVGAFRENAK